MVGHKRLSRLFSGNLAAMFTIEKIACAPGGLKSNNITKLGGGLLNGYFRLWGGGGAENTHVQGPQEAENTHIFTEPKIPISAPKIPIRLKICPK